jgi:hypothetical protein
MDVLHTVVAYFGFQSAHSFDYSPVPSKQFIDVVLESIELQRRGRSEEAGSITIRAYCICAMRAGKVRSLFHCYRTKAKSLDNSKSKSTNKSRLVACYLGRALSSQRRASVGATRFQFAFHNSAGSNGPDFLICCVGYVLVRMLTGITGPGEI